MYLVFDIGGTKTRIAVSKDGNKLDQVETIPTALDFKEGVRSFVETALKLSGDQKITVAAGGVRALNKDKTGLMPHPHFPLWENEPLLDELKREFECPVYLENDAAIGGLGEACFGPGKGYSIVAYLTISTGIGGARIVNGNIDNNSMGFEPGNQIIDLDGSILKKEGPVYLEEYIGGHALEKRFGLKGEMLNDERIWDEVTKVLSIGLNNTLVYWSPDIVILGGSGMESISLDKLNLYLRESVKIYPQLPPVVKANLGDSRGLYGAMAFLKSKF